jgi:hypothetical protein
VPGGRFQALEAVRDEPEWFGVLFIAPVELDLTAQPSLN